jgi:hypothetical protein
MTPPKSVRGSYPLQILNIPDARFGTATLINGDKRIYQQLIQPLDSLAKLKRTLPKAMFRDVILWRHFEQLSAYDMTQLLHIIEAAASKRYIRAVERLRKLLIDLGGRKSREIIRAASALELKRGAQRQIEPEFTSQPDSRRDSYRACHRIERKTDCTAVNRSIIAGDSGRFADCSQVVFQGNISPADEA